MFRVIIFCYLTLYTSFVFTQTNMIISNNTYLKLNNNSLLTISNPNVNPIVKYGNVGGIFPNSESEKIILETTTMSGTFNIPFVSSVGNTIPFEYSITTSGVGNGKIEFSTYETSNNNLPLPSGVTNINRNGIDNSLQVIDRFWLINPIGYTTKPQGTYKFVYDDNDLIGNTIDESNLFTQRWNNNTNEWGDWLNSPIFNPITNTVTVNISNTETQYKVWTVVDRSTYLPVELVEFKTDCESNRVIWKTLSEFNSDKFILQGSKNGSDFINIDSVYSVGFSTSVINYELNIQGGNYKYLRLKQLDKDGKFTYTSIIENCKTKNSTLVSLNPNPNNGIFTINHKSEYNFILYDSKGSKLDELRGSQNEFDFSYLPNGLYHLELINENENIKLKFIKK